MKTKLVRLGILVAAALLSPVIKAQTPVSAFSLSQSTVCAGNTIQLTDLSSDSPDSWLYTVDGQTLTTQNPSLSLNTAGIFSITLVASNLSGTGTAFTETVLVNPLPSLIVSATSASVCAGDGITLSTTGATSYTWSGGITEAVSFTPAVTTVYTVNGEDANGCISSVNYTVPVNALPVLTISGNTAVCIGSSISQTVTGANNYTWSTNSTSDVLTDSPLASLIYTVTGFDTNTGCYNEITSPVIVNPLPIVSALGGVICEGESFTIVPSGAMTYSYSGGNDIVSPLADANYTVNGTDANGCVSTDVVLTVSVNALPIVTVNAGIICSGENFTLVASGALTYTFSSGTNVVSPATSTSYSVNGTDANGCVSNAAVSNITVNALPVIGVNSGAICAGDIFTIVPSGALTYTISGGSNTVTPATTTAYTVDGTDANGCVSSVAAVCDVTVNPLPVLTVNSGAICLGSSLTLIPSGASTYTFSGGSNVVTPTTTTFYTVTGTDANGCVSGAPALSNVTVNALPLLTVNNGTICAGTSFTIVPSGALTYTYSGGNSVVAPNTSTNYTVTGTDANGCIGIAAVSTVSVNPLPVIAVNSGSVCAGSSFTISASGANTYTYSSGSNIVTPTTNTFYTVTGTDANACISAAAVSNVTVNALPVLSVNNGTICSGDSFTIVASGALTYTYSGGSNIVAPTTNTMYSVTGTDANGCVNAVAAISTVSVNPIPVISVNSGAICAGGSFTIVASGASTYTYSSGSNVVAPNTSTQYSVSGTDANGCLSNVAAISNVTVNALPVVSILSSTNAICVGQTAVLSGAGAFTYSWSTNTTTSSISVSPVITSNYSVIGTDANGCTGIALQTLTVNALPVMNTTSNAQVICAGEEIAIVASGANIYNWNTGSTSATLIVTPQTTTSYTVTGTDANGCSNTSSFTQNVSDCVGLTDKEMTSIAVNVFPNPSNGIFTLELERAAVAVVISADGRVINQLNLESGKNAVNLENLPNGLYFVQLEQNGKINTIKMIKAGN